MNLSSFENLRSKKDQNYEDTLRKIEMQYTQLKMEALFNKNMQIFKRYARDIYDEYIHYEAKELRLSFSSDGYLDLVNHQLKNKPVYPYNPEAFCQKQISDFEKLPAIARIRVTGSKAVNPAHIHVPLVNELIESYQKKEDTLKIDTQLPIGLLLLTGCGIGYQIAELVQRFDIYNLVIFDPHKDSFYACLHTIDWEPILKNFIAEHRMLKLLIGMEAFDAMSNLKLLTDKIGLHNLVNTFVFRHFESEKEQSFVDQYRKEFHLSASGTGFFDDEHVSFAHTTHNLSAGVPLFKFSRDHLFTAEAMPPALIIGNGPSLDKHIDFIKEHGKNCIIYSCGTALSSLSKVGIKPDFHVEMERNIDVWDWLTISTSEEDRKGVTLLCLNTASPKVIELFDDAMLAKKPNDAGEGIIDAIDTQVEFHALPLCNPTVTNAGLSFALNMGLKEVYLIGVDLGMYDEEQHHSELSPYHTLSKKTQQTGFSPMEDTSKNYKIRGNFCEEVSTNLFLDGTRVNIEILIRYHEGLHNNITIYNSNNGAHIRGTQSTPIDDLPHPTTFNSKAEFIQQLKSFHAFNTEESNVTQDFIDRRFLENFREFRQHLFLPETIAQPNDLYQAINTVYFKTTENMTKNPVTNMLLRGSLQGYFTLLMKYCYYQKTQEDFKEAYEIGKTIYHQFIHQCYDVMNKEPFRLDDTHDLKLKSLEK